MKFRDLKKKKFYWYLDEVYFLDKDDIPPYWWDSIPESYIVNDETGLWAYYYWEDDREYVWASGYTKEKYTWKELKKTIKEQGTDRRYNDLRIFNGKCERCGCKLTSENYEYKLDFYFPCERDIYYCNHCKQKQIDDMVAWYEKYDEEHKDESPMYV